MMIHFTPYPLQTGATLFAFLHSGPPVSTVYPALPPPLEPVWKYSKSEDPALSTPEGAWISEVDYVVTDDWGLYESWKGDEGEGWQVIGSVDGLNGVGRGGKWGVEVRWGRKVAILGRRKGR